MGLHGIIVDEIAEGARPVGVRSQSTIGLVGTAAAATGLDVGDTVVVRGSTEITALALGAGTIKDGLSAIFAQGPAVVVVTRVAVGEDDEETATNVAGDSTDRTGVYALLNAKALVGVKPKILIAPQFSQVAAVQSALISVANSLLGVTFLDSEDTDAADAIALAGGVSDADGRSMLLDPWVTVGGVAKPPSPFAAGVMAQVDQAEGFWVSPSNHVILGIDGTSRPISFELGDATCEAATLNEENITTIVREQGFRLWGNRGLGTEPPTAFLCVRRTADAIAESIKLAHLWAVDKTINKRFAESMLESVNGFLRRMRAAGAILGGSAWLDAELNTPEGLADGEVFIDYDFTAAPPAESITFRQRISTRYLTEVIA